MSIAALSPDQLVGPFKIVQELGRGASSIVYSARHRLSGDEVALKWLLRNADIAILKQEFRAARSLRHPNLVDLYELYDEEIGLFFTMQRVVGTDLVTRCTSIQDSAERVAKIQELFGQLADGLCALHAAGLLHRDIKPANVLVDSQDRVVLVDFGLARPLRHASSRGFSGTFLYAAPERLRGTPASPGSDWYSFGLLMLESILGFLPATLHHFPTHQSPADAHRLRFPLVREAEHLRDALAQVLHPIPQSRGTPTDFLPALTGRAVQPSLHQLVGGEATVEWIRSNVRVRRSLLVVSGPPGVGKTSLAREALRDAPDILVFSSRCHPRERIAFNALDALAIGLLAELRPEDECAFPSEVEFVRQLFAGRRKVTAAITSAEIADAFARLLDTIGEREHPVLWIDDVQWMDRDSAEVFAHLLSLTTGSATWLLTVRGGLEQVPVELPSAQLLTHEVAPLSPDQARSLALALAPSMTIMRANAIADIGGGLPLRIEQLARWHCLHRDQPVPPDFLDVLSQLSQGRSHRHLDLLHLLAAHHAALDQEVLAACEGFSPQLAYELLDVGLVELERNGKRYALALRNDQTRVALSNGTSSDLRTACHLALARAFARASPENFDAAFQHYRDAEQLTEAFKVGLMSAQQLEDRGAFHSAVERYRWLITHAPSPESGRNVGIRLASALAKAGDALASGEAYLSLVSEMPSSLQPEMRRLASEQLLRAGDVARGRAVLDVCLRDAQLGLPQFRPLQLAEVIWQRFRVRVRPLTSEPTASVSSAMKSRIDLAWSAGLSLSLIDIVSSFLAQARFTDLALRHGNVEQRARALAVEYSYTMLTGGRLSSLRCEHLLTAIEELRPQLTQSYTVAMLDLSLGAGDFFRGRLEGISERIRAARANFTVDISQNSWELANCGMYESWTALERGDFPHVARRVPELLRHGASRGDRLYRQCFVGGYCATAWLIVDRADELRDHLDSLSLPVGPFQMAHFFELLARVRLDLYIGHRRNAWRRVASAWPAIRRSGFLFLRWPRLALLTLVAQAALAARHEPGALTVARSAISALGRTDHPLAGPWQEVLCAWLRAPDCSNTTTAQALNRAERKFAQNGFLGVARALRQIGGDISPDAISGWQGVRNPDALARVLAVP